MADETDIRDRLADRPDLVAALESVLDVDDGESAWRFDDVPVDAGRFGELVDRGFVESSDGGYRLSDPAAIAAALAAEPPNGDGAVHASPDASRVRRDRLDLGGLTRRADVTETIRVRCIDFAGVLRSRLGAGRIAGLVVALALFVAVRTTVTDSVFRDGTVVLMGNDPYYYRYWTEQLLARSADPLNVGAVVDAPTGEPLLVAALWWVSALFGGSPEAAGVVLAWYPIAAGLAVAVLTYLLGARVFDDHRVGLVAVVVLAVVPGHAMRTALGFADHHAFDYVWLLATIVALARLAETRAASAVERGDGTATFGDGSGLARLRTAFGGRRTALAATALGVAVAGLTLAWNGSPVVLAPLALYLFVRTLRDVRADRSPLRGATPVLAALGLATAIATAAHLALGWQSATVVLVPPLLLCGGVAAAALGAVGRRRDLSTTRLALFELALVAFGLAVLSQVSPAALGELGRRLSFLFSRTGIGETTSLFAPSRGFGVDALGLVHVLALPSMASALWWAARDDRWLVVTLHAWWFFLLAALQLRFVGQLSPLLAFFAAVTLLRLLDRLDLAAPITAIGTGTTGDDGTDSESTTDAAWLDLDALTVRSGVTALVVVALLVGPAAWGAPGVVSSPAVADRTHETATWIADDADRRGLSDAERYVFSRWGDNRAYNYVVSGDSESYGYAQANFTKFLDGDDPERWYERLENRTGYVVLTAIERFPNTIFQHLWTTHGSRWPAAGYDAVSHYRAVYVSSDYRTKVFVPVAGARLLGTAASNATVDASTRVRLANDNFDYRKHATAGPDGRYRLVVPYPGEYELTVGNETRTVSVSESAVERGANVTVDERGPSP